MIRKMNDLPVLYKNGLFFKLKNFFKSLFKSKAQKSEEINPNKEIIQELKDNAEFSKNLKYEIENKVSEEYKKREFIDKIEENPELLNELSVDRLKKLVNYYDEIILDYKDKIKKISA